MTEGRHILDQQGVQALGEAIARHLAREGRVFLRGELGTGKTTLARAIIRALGVTGAIPSPSYIMDAVYLLPDMEIHHIDLYRLSGDPMEMSLLGFDQILESDSVVIVEWADRLGSIRSMPGFHVSLELLPDPMMREVLVERRMAGD